MRKVLSILIGTAVLAGLPGFAAAADKWDMPTPYPDGNYHTQNVRQFAADVKEMSDGQLEIVVHSGASLFKMPEIKRAVRSGQAQIGEILLSAYGNENPIFEVDGIPFLAARWDNAWNLWQARRPILEEIMAKEGIKVLYAVAWPGQSLYSKTEVNSLADMRGVTFRAYNAATSRLAELMGALPTTVQYAEVPQAFATGLVSAMLTSGTTGVDVQAWDFVDYFINTDAMHPNNLIMVNQRAFDRLAPEVQEAVLKAAAVAEERGWKMAREAGDEAVKTLAEQGMKVVEPSATLLEQLETIGETMTEEWLAKAGADGRRLIDAYRSM